ncbi:MAG: heme o synthase [Saprospiraceae bacterium]|nr:heme o synthase [Saprospiraceae bacterium]
MVLAKMRLNLIVVFSAIMGYIFAGTAAASSLVWLFLGGFLVTMSSNTINQILERDFDKLMKRTQNRPIPNGRVGVMEAWLIAGISGLLGLVILWMFFNPIASLLGALSLFVYAFIYTPMKRFSPLAVFIGAIPGALPPMIGWAAATGGLTFEAWVLFSFQFLWQFPHFWAIAWLAFEDYKKAGYKLLPDGEKTNNMPIQSIIYCLALAFLAFVPFYFEMISLTVALVCAIAAVFYMVPAIRLLRNKDDVHAKQLMYASFLYLPVVFTALVIG